jgi:geranyl-CoA carboxylase alpha subunit
VAVAGGVPGELFGWSSAAPLPVLMTLTAGDRTWQVALHPEGAGWQARIDDEAAIFVAAPTREDGAATLTLDGRRVHLAFVAGADGVSIMHAGRQMRFARPGPGAAPEGASASGRVTAPMHGLLTEICVAPGDRVAAGDRLAVLEAMKMQHRIEAPEAGVVLRVAAAEGAQLASGDLIVEIDGDAA